MLWAYTAYMAYQNVTINDLFVLRYNQNDLKTCVDCIYEAYDIPSIHMVSADDISHKT